MADQAQDRWRWDALLDRLFQMVTSPAQHGRSQSILSHAVSPTIRDSTFNIYAGIEPSTPQLNVGGTPMVSPETSSSDRSQSSTPRSRIVDNLMDMARSPSLNPSEYDRSSAEIYGYYLQRKGLGHPLWIPEPDMNLSEFHRRSGVELGDVGIITAQRGFAFLFNIFHDANHPLNSSMHLPHGFVPFQQRPNGRTIVHNESAGSFLAPSNMARIDSGEDPHKTVLETSAKESAVLMLPAPMYGKTLMDILPLQMYVKEHIEGWYVFVRNVLGWDVKNGDILVVHSFRKSTGYGIATVSNGGDRPVTELTFLINESWSGSSGCKYRWTHRGYAETKTGPTVHPGHDTPHPSPHADIDSSNQCLFIGTIDLTLQEDKWNAVIVNTSLSTVEEGFAPGHINIRTGGLSDKATSDSTSKVYPSAVSGCGVEGRSRPILPSDMLASVLLAVTPNVTCAVINAKNWGPWLDETVGKFFGWFSERVSKSLTVAYAQNNGHQTPDVVSFVENVLKNHEVCLEQDIIFLEPVDIKRDRRMNLSARWVEGSMPQDKVKSAHTELTPLTSDKYLRGYASVYLLEDGMPISNLMSGQIVPTANPQTIYTPEAVGTGPTLKFLTIPATNKHTATVIFVHGLGGTGFGWKPLVDMFRADRGLAHVKWILPHAPVRAVTANMSIERPSWFDMYSYGYNADEDEANMLHSMSLLEGLIRYESKTSNIDPSRILLGGFNQGATMSILTGLTKEPSLAGIAALSGWIPLRNKFKEMTIPGIVSSIPIFWGAGAEDNLVRMEISDQSVEFLTVRVGVPRAAPGVPGGLTYNVYEGMGHTTNKRELAELKEFIKSVLPPD